MTTKASPIESPFIGENSQNPCTFHAEKNGFLNLFASCSFSQDKKLSIYKKKDSHGYEWVCFEYESDKTKQTTYYFSLNQLSAQLKEAKKDANGDFKVSLKKTFSDGLGDEVDCGEALCFLGLLFSKQPNYIHQTLSLSLNSQNELTTISLKQEYKRKKSTLINMHHLVMDERPDVTTISTPTMLNK